LALDVYKEWLGIPEGPRPPDHYQLLRLVQFEDSVDKIRANYKKLNAHVRRYATGQYLDESQALLNELAKVMLCLTDLERKREYDQSQGREFEEEASGPRTMDMILVEQKHISPEQAKEARAHAERAGLDLRDAFVQLKMVDQDLAAQALAQELGLPYVDLAETLPEDKVLDQVPKATVKQHSILPLFIDEGVLLVACVNHIGHDLEDELRMRFSAPVRSVLASPQALSQAINKFYSPDAIAERADRKSEAESEGKPEKGKSKKSAPEVKKEKPKPKPRSVKSAEDLKNQRMIGIVVVNFSFFLAYLLDMFVFQPGALFQPLWPYFVIPGIAAAFSYVAFWKK
jgi:MshEN domain